MLLTYLEQNLYDMWIWTSAGIFDMVLAEGGVSMKKTTREQCEEVIAARVEWLVTRWQEDKTQEEKKADHKLNERMDHWMKEITKEQRDAIEDCIDDMLDGNGMCQLYLYEEGVKDGIRLMKMIRDM